VHCEGQGDHLRGMIKATTAAFKQTTVSQIAITAALATENAALTMENGDLKSLVAYLLSVNAAKDKDAAGLRQELVSLI
jgi:hypothetical protein